MKTKFGIVGCGFLGNIVADAWKKGLLEDYELVGVTSRTASTEAASTMYSGSSANRASTSAQAAQPTLAAVFSAEAKVRLVTPTSS